MSIIGIKCNVTLNGIKEVIIRDDIIGNILTKWERITPNGAWKRTK